MKEEEDHKKEEGGGEGLPTRTDHECELSQMQEEGRRLIGQGRRQQWVGNKVGGDVERRREGLCGWVDEMISCGGGTG